MLPFLGSALRRSSAFRSRTFLGAFAAADKDRGAAPSSDRKLRALRRTVVGALVVGGSGLALWLTPSASSFPDSFVSFADSGMEQGDLGTVVSPGDPKMRKKGRIYLLKDSYRKRVFFNYEKRIRTQSSPEKSFQYFASSQNAEGEICMTPTDLMRAVVHVFPPSESDIVREGFLNGEPDPGELHCSPSKFFMLFDTNNDGLISFPEYIFFLTLLSVPESSFSVAFKMFDVDNNGEIDRGEFKKVMALMRSYYRQGASHKNGLRSGLKVSSSENGGLLEHFFGKDGNQRLHHDKFVQFLRDLHDEILQLEFAHYDFKSRGTISAMDFALSMVASADMNHINRLLDRVNEMDNSPHLRDMRITFEEFKTFDQLRKRLTPLALAIFGFGKVNGLLTKQDFIRASSHVCGVSLTQNVVDVIFHVFDANSDGNLSSEEFLAALPRQETGVRFPSSGGVMGFLTCCLNCTKSSPPLFSA